MGPLSRIRLPVSLAEINVGVAVMKKRRGNGSSAFLLRAEREKTHLAAAAAAYGDGREGRRAASPPEVDAAQLLAMDTTKRPLRLTAPSYVFFVAFFVLGN